MGEITHRSNNETYTFETPPADSTIEVLNEFYWTKESEPHVTRRKQILAKYPEVRKLTGYEPKTKWYIFGILILQFSVAYYLRNTSLFSFKFIALAYLIGATCNQAIFLAIHEATS